MGLIHDLFGGGATSLIQSVGQTLDQVITTREEKMQLENEIRKATLQFESEMRKLDVEEKGVLAGEMNSARQREVAVQTNPNATRLSKNVSSLLALGTTILTFTLFYILIFRHEAIGEKSKDVVLYILGVLSAILSQIFSYYFGSSLGSADKSRMIENLKSRE